uniref:Eukaryotic peptide chain release factor subunit 1 n=1 Tax=Euplotes aediculatus TaxID=5940 RepID=Q9BMX1_EUPAE|nr:eukaryotic release factor 1B [Euplotes aediculatus]AAK70862.1 polypeptide chain release factor 1 [Euplotes aediculatus]
MSVLDSNVETWKIKRLIKNLEKLRGNGTSMISLLLSPRDQISKVQGMLAGEAGTAVNIKSRVNRLAVLSAITSAKERLKLYTRTPNNGLVVYCGTVIGEDGSEKKYTIDFEPFRPLNTFKYICDNKFCTEPLFELLENDDTFGFVVVDGSGCLFGTLQGNSRTILQQISVSLPKKHGRGGQSAPRFGRIREEKRHNYVRKVAELSTQHFITDDRPNVKGLILAGSANFKNDLSGSDLFDKRLAEVVIKIVDVSYGGENGFSQAISLAEDALSNVKFVEEKNLISKYFEQIALDTGMIVFGVEDTLHSLEIGALDLLMCFENLEINRYEIRDSANDEIKIYNLNKEQEKDPKYFKNEKTGADLEIIKSGPLSEWLCENYSKFGIKLEFITDKSQEGFQFVNGFGGIGGFLRFKLEIENNDYDHDEIGGEEFNPDEDFI